MEITIDYTFEFNIPDDLPIRNYLSHMVFSLLPLDIQLDVIKNGSDDTITRDKIFEYVIESFGFENHLEYYESEIFEDFQQYRIYMDSQDIEDALKG